MLIRIETDPWVLQSELSPQVFQAACVKASSAGPRQPSGGPKQQSGSRLATDDDIGGRGPNPAIGSGSRRSAALHCRRPRGMEEAGGGGRRSSEGRRRWKRPSASGSLWITSILHSATSLRLQHAPATEAWA
ncbi:hypothetical protein HPB47_011680 [Ixodes persulcatus]|uniref:Uncharacterized protein n=1 Tax=Ixodes persulcatus TaxID=34615 RepID=A0AC60NVZ3_IXOPE|nr:hypothetical protein HPB47_011680 [Ixodes persulcatus]